MGAKGREVTADGARVREYEQCVTQEMVLEYGITWADACGDFGPLVAAIEAGQSPAEFVQRWGEKYDLIPKSEWR